MNLLSAADGTLYIADMYRGVIQHGQYQSEYLKNQIRARGLVEPTGLGRIYRVVHETTRRAAASVALGEDAGRTGRRCWSIRTAGGATPHSGCSSSAAIGRSRRRWPR